MKSKGTLLVVFLILSFGGRAALAQSLIRSWQTPNSTTAPAEPNVASGAGYVVQTGANSGMAVYVESTGLPAANGPCGPGGLCPPVSNFWRLTLYSQMPTQFTDARVIYWSQYQRWVMITLDGSTFNPNQIAPTPFDIAISPGSDPTVPSTQWAEYQVMSGCPRTTAPLADFPRLAGTTNWLVVVHDCMTTTQHTKTAMLHAIEANGILTRGVLADHLWTAPDITDIPGIVGDKITHVTPVDLRYHGSADSTAYLGAWMNPTVTPGTNLQISTIVGAQSAPGLCSNVFRQEFCCTPVGGGACIAGGTCALSDIRPNGPITPIPADGSKRQVGCVNFNDGKAIGDEDTWANGDQVLEFVEDEANGTSTASTRCNGSYSVWTGSAIIYATIDTHQIGSQTCATPAWTIPSFFLRTTSGGASEQVYPAAAHLISGGQDYVALTYTHSDTTTPLNPTMGAAVYLGNGNPPTGIQAQLLADFDVQTSTPGSSTYSNRWGDYAGAWPSAGGFFDLSSDLFLSASHTGYIAEVTP